MRSLVGLLALLALLAPLDVDARCRCRLRRPARCADPGTLHRVTVAIDFTVVDGTVEVITQTGLYRVPVADLDGKNVLFLVTNRSVIFQGSALAAEPPVVLRAVLDFTPDEFHGFVATIEWIRRLAGERHADFLAALRQEIERRHPGGIREENEEYLLLARRS